MDYVIGPICAGKSRSVINADEGTSNPVAKATSVRPMRMRLQGVADNSLEKCLSASDGNLKVLKCCS